MKTVHIATVIVRGGDGYYLQRRGSDPKVGAASLLGGFGGKIEATETPIQAAVREFKEETGIDLNASVLSPLGRVEVQSDLDLEPVNVIATVFLMQLGDKILIDSDNDSQGIEYIAASEIPSRLPEMTPSTKAAFIEFILKGEN